MSHPRPLHPASLDSVANMARPLPMPFRVSLPQTPPNGVDAAQHGALDHALSSGIEISLKDAIIEREKLLSGKQTLSFPNHDQTSSKPSSSSTSQARPSQYDHQFKKRRAWEVHTKHYAETRAQSLSSVVTTTTPSHAHSSSLSRHLPATAPLIPALNPSKSKTNEPSDSSVDGQGNVIITPSTSKAALKQLLHSRIARRASNPANFAKGEKRGLSLHDPSPLVPMGQILSGSISPLHPSLTSQATCTTAVAGTRTECNRPKHRTYGRVKNNVLMDLFKPSVGSRQYLDETDTCQYMLDAQRWSSRVPAKAASGAQNRPIVQGHNSRLLPPVAHSAWKLQRKALFDAQKRLQVQSHNAAILPPMAHSTWMFQRKAVSNVPNMLRVQDRGCDQHPPRAHSTWQLPMQGVLKAPNMTQVQDHHSMLDFPSAQLSWECQTKPVSEAQPALNVNTVQGCGCQKEWLRANTTLTNYEYHGHEKMVGKQVPHSHQNLVKPLAPATSSTQNESSHQTKMAAMDKTLLTHTTDTTKQKSGVKRTKNQAMSVVVFDAATLEAMNKRITHELNLGTNDSKRRLLEKLPETEEHSHKSPAKTGNKQPSDNAERVNESEANYVSSSITRSKSIPPNAADTTQASSHDQEGSIAFLNSHISPSLRAAALSTIRNSNLDLRSYRLYQK